VLVNLALTPHFLAEPPCLPAIKLTRGGSPTYIPCVINKRISGAKKFRHVYCHISRKTPWHFRFSVTSPIFKDPEHFGRPIGVFNADCWGVTEQDTSNADATTRVKLSEDPNTARRFPLASAFTSREACALECDFWKLVLRRKFFLEIPWSHASQDEFLFEADLACQNPMVRLHDESQWSHELLDFINEHQSLLFRHRDAYKPELDLDEYERVAKEKDNWQLRTWVECMRLIQSDLAALPDDKRLRALSKHLNVFQGVRMPPCPPADSPFHRSFAELSNALMFAAGAGHACGRLIDQIAEERRRLEAALREQISQRPQIL